LAKPISFVQAIGRAFTPSVLIPLSTGFYELGVIAQKIYFNREYRAEASGILIQARMGAQGDQARRRG